VLYLTKAIPQAGPSSDVENGIPDCLFVQEVAEHQGKTYDVLVDQPADLLVDVSCSHHYYLQLDRMLEGGNPLASEVEARIARMSELMPSDQPPHELRSHAAPPLHRRNSHIAGVTEVPWQLGQVREHAAQGTG
jgi:hypothetical protein